jgi:3-hydroxyacyl-CoA dehydrogenase/3-phenylpropionate/cinnamic acid dioxygenase small subunit
MEVRIAIVGAGSIGVGWAVLFAGAGFDVVVHDPDPERLEAAPREVRSRLDELAGFGLLDEAPSVPAARAAYSGDLTAALAGCSYVQECAPEDVALKRELFALLDVAAPGDAVLASSSSTIPCSAFAADLAGRTRCLVAHPGNPPFLLPVVELVPAPFTRADVADSAAELLTAAGMSVVRVRKEIEGFVFNRLQGALLREAYCLVRDGVADVEDVDRVVRDGLGRRWAFIGPFETADLNTRGGIEVHARRLGPPYERMGAERGQHDPWTNELIRRVVEERRRLLPLEDWEDRVAWRDRMLMAFERVRRSLPSDNRARMRDRMEITSVLHRYCAMLDRMDLDLVPTLFTDDCLVVYGPDERMQSRGAADLALSLRRLWRFDRTSHHLSNVEIEFMGDDEARAQSYVLAWHRRPDGSSNTLYAEYRDRLVRTERGWRIAERRQLTHGSDAPWDRPLAEAERLPGQPC